jgi:hypothetical protein
MSIVPKIGQNVLYYRAGYTLPLAAIIVSVSPSKEFVNLVVFNTEGVVLSPPAPPKILMVQDDMAAPNAVSYCRFTEQDIWLAELMAERTERFDPCV